MAAFQSSLVFCVLTLSINAARPQENVFERLVGKWRDGATAVTIIIEEDGSVFSADGSLAGSVSSTIEGGGNFAFEGSGGRCVYDIEFLGGPFKGATSWGLKTRSWRSKCISTGIFFPVESSASDAQKSSITESASRADEQIQTPSVNDNLPTATDGSAGNPIKSSIEAVQEELESPIPLPEPEPEPEPEVEPSIHEVNQSLLELEEINRVLAGVDIPPAKPQKSSNEGIFADTHVYYFEKSDDGDTVTNALSGLSSLGLREYTPMSSTLGSRSNVLACVPGVPVAAVREMLLSLIRHDVPIKLVRAYPGQTVLSLTIERFEWLDRKPFKPLTISDVGRLQACEARIDLYNLP